MNSSMLNSDTWRRALRLPVRTHAWHLMLLAGALGLTLAASAFLAWLNPKAAASERIEADYSRVEVLLIGNSQYRCIDTAQFCRPALNISIGGSDYSTQYALLRNLAPEMPELKVLIIALDNLPLRTPAIARRKGDYEQLYRWGVPWWDIPDIPFMERARFFITRNRLLKPVLTGPKLDEKELARYLSFARLRRLLLPQAAAAEKGADSPETDDAGDLPPPDVVREGFSFAPARGKGKINGYSRELTQRHNLESNRNAFFGMVRYCRDHEIRLVFLRTATTKAFWQNRPPEWDAEIAALRRQAEALYGGEIPLWDEERSYDYDDTQFDDPNHLMPRFIQSILSPRIDQRLRKLLDAPPCVLPL
jgi:hypothetical protein